MRAELLAFDSMGVRSMSTFVETKDLRVHIDPAAALAPRRYGLPPHRREVDRLLELGRAIEGRAREADVIVVTHYHYDHHDPGRLVPVDVYRGKLVYLKDPSNNINYSQRMRARRFLELIGPLAREVKVAEGSALRAGSTELRFSGPVPHGPTTRLGYVVEVSIREGGGEAMAFTSDVEGPCLEEQASFLLEEARRGLDLAVVDGPMTYMLGYRYGQGELEASLENLSRAVEAGVGTMVLDHHFMRDRSYAERIGPLLELARARGSRVVSAAEYMGRPIEMLEAERDRLYREEPGAAGDLRWASEE